MLIPLLMSLAIHRTTVHERARRPQLRRTHVGALLALLAIPAEAAAQDSATSTLVSTAPLSTASTCQRNDVRLQATLPEPTLRLLERMPESPFVQAFLIAHVVETAPADHWMSACARQFLDAAVGDVQALRASKLNGRAVLAELRDAEARRTRRLELQEEGNATLRSVVTSLLGDMSQGNIEVSISYLGGFQQEATIAAPIRNDIARAVGAGQKVLNTWRARHAAERYVSILQDSITQTDRRLTAVTLALSDDTATHRLLVLADDTAALAEHEAAMDMHRNDRTTLSALLAGLRSSADQWRKEEADAEHRIHADIADLRLQLEVLKGKLYSSSAAEQKLTATATGSTTPVAGRLNAPTPNSVPLSNSAQRASASDIMVVFTDFIVERAKQELVLGYLAQMYRWMHQQPELRPVFPETYGALKALMTDPNSDRLPVNRAGRIPFGTWRATMLSDFVALPLNLTQHGGPLVCGIDPDCLNDLARMRVVSRAASGMLAGEPVFDVMRRLATDAGVGRPAGEEWSHVLEALTILSNLANAYRLQGTLSGANIVDHPYIATSDVGSLQQRQRNALVRVVVADAFVTDTARDLDAAQFQSGIQTALRTLETLLHELDSSRDEEHRTGRVIRAALTSLTSAIDIAAPLTSDTIRRARLGEVRNLWNAINGAITGIASREYGLALTRTTILVGHVSGEHLSPQMLSLIGAAGALADAQDGAQVRAAFETAAAPVGGWQAKRYREARPFSITAYPGLSGGVEWVRKDMKGAPHGGVSLPIGFEWQFHGQPIEEKRCYLGICSAGLILGVLDLGTLLNYRLSGSDNVETAPNEKVSTILAPSLHVSLGLGRLPLSVLVGAQGVPGLRSVEGERSSAGDALRASLGLAVDVTLFSF